MGQIDGSHLLIGGLAFLAVLVIGYQVWWHMKYRTEYSETRTDKGVVTDMDYTAPRTSVTKIGKTTSVSTSPAKHEVFIKFEFLGEKDFNDEELYQTVRLDDEITAEFREEFRVEKADPRKRESQGYEIDVIISPKGRRVSV